ncbi:MAG TPA: hypothetical protein VFD39_07825 [Trueperaceae bacterium]|nr:hypothetical protein [Trueperaceae bacterium]
MLSEPLDVVTESFAELLAGEFYVDVDMIKDAVRQGRAFNVIHLESMFKADIFTMQEGAWPSEELTRARTEELHGPQGSFTVRFASPEDTLLHKLVCWYRMGKTPEPGSVGDAASDVCRTLGTSSGWQPRSSMHSRRIT